MTEQPTEQNAEHVHTAQCYAHSAVIDLGAFSLWFDEKKATSEDDTPGDDEYAEYQGLTDEERWPYVRTSATALAGHLTAMSALARERAARGGLN